MKGKDFVFDYADFLYCKCHKINLKRDGSYIDSPDWIKNKKSTCNPANAVTVVLHQKDMGKKSESISTIHPFIDEYN